MYIDMGKKKIYIYMGKNMYIYMGENMYIYMGKYIYICVCVCVCLCSVRNKTLSSLKKRGGGKSK
jgi:hypothetical protein